MSELSERKAWGIMERFTIGPPECPIMERLTIVRHRRLGSLRLHRFLPNADDRDVHDHPWDFVTLVLRGEYADMGTCPGCRGRGLARAVTPALYTDTLGNRSWVADGFQDVWCERCRGTGLALHEMMTPGKLRLRRATHQHRTRVGPRGCTTIVATGPMVRAWGFLRDGRWIPWRDYEAEFGHGMRCDEDRDVSFARAHLGRKA